MKRLIAFTGLLLLLAGAAFSGDGTATSQQTKLYGNLVFFDDTLANAKVTATLSGKNYFYTSALTVASGELVAFSDANGYFSMVVWGVDSLFPAKSATYSITVEQPELQAGGIVFQVSGLVINADGDSTDIRDVLAQ